MCSYDRVISIAGQYAAPFGQFVSCGDPVDPRATHLRGIGLHTAVARTGVALAQTRVGRAAHDDGNTANAMSPSHVADSHSLAGHRRRNGVVSA